MAAREHENEHHCTLGQCHTTEISRAVGQQHAGLQNLVDLDMVQAIGLDLYEFDARIGRYVNQMAADIASQINDCLSSLELIGEVLITVKHPHIKTVAEGGYQMLSPFDIDILNRMGQIQNL